MSLRALLADVVYGDNMRMRKAGGGLGFLFKAGKGLLVKAFTLNDFDGYGAAEPGVLSLEDDTPPPSPSFFATLYLPPWNDSNTAHLLPPLAQPIAHTYEQFPHDLYNHTRE